MQHNSSISIVGSIEWAVLDRASLKFIRGGKGKNLTVDAGLNAIATSLAGGAQIIVDTIKIGTADNVFVAGDTDLYSVLESKTATVSSTDNIVEAETFFTFSGPEQIEECGLFAGGTAWALTNEITEDVNPTQMLSIIWSVEFQANDT